MDTRARRQRTHRETTVLDCVVGLYGLDTRLTETGGQREREHCVREVSSDKSEVNRRTMVDYAVQLTLKTRTLRFVKESTGDQGDWVCIETSV